MINKILLILIIVVSIFSRFTGLLKVPPSLFADEVDVAYQVKSFLTTGKDYYGNFLPLQFHSFSDVRTALPIYATILVSRLPGMSIDLAVRLTPAIFSIVSIAGIYFFVEYLLSLYKIEQKKHFLRPGLFASFTLAIIPWHYTYSRTGFELSMLLAFVILGFVFFFRYLQKNETWCLVLSCLLLALTPAIYSTAKLAVLAYPILFLFLPGVWEKFSKFKSLKIYLVLMLVPLLIIMINGGAGKRFSEISILTDPTISTEVDYMRQSDLGLNAAVGSKNLPASILAHNKPLSISQTFIKNFYTPFSIDYLFVSGDPNLRQAVPGWGMFEKVLLIPLVLGLYLLITDKKTSLILFLAGLSVAAVFPSALTRDGAMHASRTFMLILPLVTIISYGFYRLLNFSKILSFTIIFVLFFETFLFFHDYWIHYPIASELSFHAGLKELVSESNKYADKPVILTRTYEPALIFYLYYGSLPIPIAQQLIKTNTIVQDIDPSLNLEGQRVGDSQVYLASLKDVGTKDPLRIKGAVYVLSTEQSKVFNLPPVNQIYLPSGNLLFTTIINLPYTNSRH